MRVLNFVKVDDGRRTVDDAQSSIVHGQWSELWQLPASEHPFPLPNNSRTEPHLAVKPHVAMGNDLEKKISNYEEIRPKHQKSEMPLVVFTLLAQMAVGAFWAAQWMVDTLPFVAYLAIGACLAVGGFFSFAHLGAKRNAWRAPWHLTKSWLSREILFVGLFGMGWLIGFMLPEMKWVTSLLGVGLIFCMAKVYQLRSIPAWNTWRTMAGFFVTAALLGCLVMINFLDETRLAWGIVTVFLVLELALTLSAKSNVQWAVNRLRVGAIVGAGIMSFVPNPLGVWTSLPIFLIVMVEEIIGRWLFYEALQERAL